MPPNGSGFGPADGMELLLTILLIGAAYLWSSRAQLAFTRLAANPLLSVATLTMAPIALRLLLLPHHPVPAPEVYDEFSHLLAADTFAHLRLANPAHPFHRFFETFFVLQQPTYSSIYPPGQGLLLAFGRLISGHPWTGVLLCSGALSGACYWALRGYLAPNWALLGGILTVIQFGPLNVWTNAYWGGTLPATAGCLVFGSLPRLANSLREGRARTRDSLLLGAGFSVHMITRPFETLFLLAAIILFAAMFLGLRERATHMAAAVAGAPVAAGLLLLGMQNRAVTGDWFTLTEKLSQYQYGVPTSLTIEQPVTPHLSLTREQALDYRAQFLMHGPGRDTAKRFFTRMLYRVRYYRFFFLPPLYIALAGFLFRLRNRLFAWVAIVTVLFGLGTNLFPYLLVHYLAAVLCLFVLMAVAGLEILSRWRIQGVQAGEEIVRVLVVLCVAPFLFWYGGHLLEGPLGLATTMQLLQYESWDSINHQLPDRRRAVAEQLEAIPGKVLVFVHYAPHHIFQNEWVWNAADIDAARVVWARDRGAAENQKLMAYYRDRAVFLLEPDLEQPRLERSQISR